jgi:hypothetical protein
MAAASVDCPRNGRHDFKRQEAGETEILKVDLYLTFQGAVL